MKRSAGLILAILLFKLNSQAQVVAYDFSSLYQSTSPAVVQVTTDDGAASGFVVTPFGHIATNFHVVRNSRYLAVQFFDGRKVKAEVIATNAKYDMALLKVNSELVQDIQPLPLLPEENDSTIKVGIPVIALGSPRDQKFVMTQGILSKVDEETVLGDFLLQPGNSGGPLLNIKGEVVAINTFADGSISGAMRIGTLRGLLKTDGIWESISVEPSAAALPRLPSARYPVDILNVKIQTEPFDWSRYRIQAGDFTVTAMTPVFLGKAQAIPDRMREVNRYVRRAKDISNSEIHTMDEPYYEWHRSTEKGLDFAVTFEIRPNAGPVPRGKLSSLVSRMTLGKVGRNRDVEFKAEFADFRLYRDGQLMQPVTPGRQLVQGKSEQEGESGRFLDEAFAGSYVYSPHDFMTGNEFKIQIVDARRPNDIYKEITLSADSPMIRQIRSDFSYSPNFVFTKLP